MGAITKLLVTIIMAVLISMGLCIAVAIPTMFLWNYLVPDITRGALTSITFWQAFWLNFLTSILFKPMNFSKR